MWILSVMEFTRRLIIDRLTNSPGHGRSKIDGINGAEKKYLK